MTARLVGPITVVLDDGPIRTRYSHDPDGKPQAVLVIGEGSKEVGITVTHSPAETLAQLQEAAAELAVWIENQDLIKQLPEVA